MNERYNSVLLAVLNPLSLLHAFDHNGRVGDLGLVRPEVSMLSHPQGFSAYFNSSTNSSQPHPHHNPPWTTPLYSSHQNSLNPLFANAVSIGISGVIGLFALYQLAHLVSLKKPTTNKKSTPLSQVLKVFLVVLQTVFYATLHFLSISSGNELTSVFSVSLLLQTGLLALLILPIHVYEPKVSGVAAASTFIYWILNFWVLLLVSLQDSFSSHKIYAVDSVGYAVEYVLTVNSLVVFFLQLNYYQPLFETSGLQINFPEYITFSWISPLIKKIADTDKVEYDDLPPIGDDISCDVTFGALGGQWDKRLNQSLVDKKNFKPSWLPYFRKFTADDVKPSLLLSIVFAFLGYIMLALFFESLDILFSYTQPYLLRKLIQHFTDSITASDAEYTGPPIIKGFAIATGMFILSSTKSLILNQMYIYMFKFVFVIDSALTTLIYRKALKLSPQARKDKPTGEIINHVSMDVSVIKWFCQDFQNFYGAPIKLLVSLYSLFRLIGNATWGGLVMGSLMIPLAAYANANIYPLYMEMMKYKDERTSLINEILISIKSVKLYSWEKPMLDKLQVVRNDKELETNKKMGVLNAISTFLWNCIPFFVSCASYGTYVYLYDVPLTPEIVFPALVYFDLLSDTVMTVPNLFSSTIEATASLKRVRDYLLLDELDLDKNGLYRTGEPTESGQEALKIQNATFLWSSEAKPSKEYKDEEEVVEGEEPKDKNIALHNINLVARTSELTCVVGRVGSGKTTLLRAALGEIPLATKEYSDEVTAATGIQVNGTIAYCPQSPWILNATVKENILFGHRYDKEFYQKTIDACELISDFKSLPDGDRTVVGEKGISLSGGQKARISLARAVYSRADIYLLDDILSAVDSHVGKNLIKNVLAKDGIIGPRTKILATNSVRVLYQADQIYLLKSGSITESGTYNEVISGKSDLATLIEEFGRGKDDEVEESDEETQETEIKVHDSEDEIEEFTGENTAVKIQNKLRRASVVSYTHEYADDEDDEGVVKKTGHSDEFSASGGVKLSTILEYCRACDYKYVSVYVILTFGISLLGIGEKYVLTYWTQINADLGYTSRPWFFLGIYAAFGILSGALLLFSSFVIWSFCIVKGAAYFHEKMAKSVLRAPMSYFETTPIGRILNRFSDDIGAIDMHLPWMLIMLLTSVLSGVTALSVIIINLPIMALLIAGMLVIYNHFRAQFIPSSRELKRLSKVAKSPLLATIQESVNGVDTIKAFNQSGRFAYRTKNYVDKFILISYVSQCCNRWLSLRLQFISSTILFFSSILATSTLLTDSPIQPGLLGFIMSFALSITSILSMIVRVWAEVETQSVALERIVEYCNLTPEAEMIVEDHRPPANWPTEGTVTFKNYSTKYRANLDPVLHGISATIKSKEKVGIVGRTGAGKSSLTLALFRIIEATGGHIEIDGVDTSKLGLYDLRYNLNIIPQESHTIKGSIRDNLDPFQQYTDEKLWKVLALAHLKEHVEQMVTKPTEQEIKSSKNPDELETFTGLQAKLDEAGSNLSAGQRQLLSLARALLNDRTKILILDEATSSVDVETDKIIQDTIRSEFKDKTILTIAHRLETIMDSDRVLVLDKGEIKEFDTPTELLKNKESIFYSLCEQGGYLKK